MNQTFSFSRWNLLVARHWAENSKRYVLSVIAFMSLLAVWFIFLLLVNDNMPLTVGWQSITYLFTLFVAGPFYASQFFRPLGSKPKAIDYLMTPASGLEKTLCGIFYAVILFPVVFTAAFYLVDAVVVGIAHLVHPAYTPEALAANPVYRKGIFNVFDPVGIPKQAVYYELILFFIAQSAYLLGSVYFARYSYIKTAISLSLIFLVYGLIGLYLPTRILSHGYFKDAPFFYEFYTDDGAGQKLVALPRWVGETIINLLLFGPFPVLWIATYFRIKEKEV